ncbi:PEGA domain-containing protein [Winogradskyella litoriviva]|uniref:PEGA domain-containing protein n=1 Tax=Winogradskyella litoriviva TaxID=1220182 RepID=A0ABX2E6E4_9FLAO|nr:PEGA domain-containing protein [Winogradskyella litoriviva]NRD24088.1 PEGA domain-containing protein [Winogradskyella litoriviva]
MKKLIFVGFIASLMLCTSCASIFTGSKRLVLFESNPSGAKVFVNGFEKGTTPTQIKVAADDRIDFKIDGYKERVVIMDSKFNLVAILNGFSIIGWGVDAITGSLKRVDTKYVKVDLETSKDNASIKKYLDEGTINKVDINTVNKVIETVIVLN